MKCFHILRVINNNVILVQEQGKETETVLIGKGLGFSRKPDMEVQLDEKQIEKSFLSYDNKNKSEYLSLIEQLDNRVVEVCSEIIIIAEKSIGKLSQRLNIVLTDHIGFAIERLKNGLEIQNPFISEIKILYPKEYQIGLIAKKMIKEQVGVDINEDEVGFIALHLNAARKNKEAKETLKETIAIRKMVSVIEEGLGVVINSGLDYTRLLNHLRGGIKRTQNGGESINPLIEAVQRDLKDCYSIAYKVGEIAKEALGVEFPEGELGYLAIHIDRLKRSVQR
ncbi:MAG: PRD domain-containing protein [Oscillospiraceae bacterium]|nr:PRD domain-containing protein [Oscillospiraceae bacterium]